MNKKKPEIYSNFKVQRLIFTELSNITLDTIKIARNTIVVLYADVWRNFLHSSKCVNVRAK